MKTKLSIATKIGFAIGVIVAGYAGSMAYGSWDAMRTEHRLAQLSSSAVPSALDAQAALFAFEDAVKRLEDALLTGDADGLAAMHQRLGHLTQLITGLSSRRENLGETSSDLAATTELVARYGQRAEPVFQLVTTKGVKDADSQAQLAEFRKLSESTRLALTAIDTRQTTSLRGALNELEASTRHGRWVDLTVFLSVVISGSLIAALIVSRAVVRPVLRLAGTLVKEGESVNVAASQFSEASGSLATGASQSAAALETSSAALEEITSLTRANAERAQNAKQLATRARQAADAGTDGVKDLRVAMDAIQDASRNISAIIKTIDEIAFQTNILALNAAVEAARAGEAGAGFAVVADEVRTLAQRSKQAAHETEQKIEQATLRSNQGANLSEKVADHLGEIAARVREVDDLIVQIANASQEQSQGIEQVSRGITELDNLTQRNAALAEETSSSAHELGSQTGRLRDVASAFNQLARGSSGDTAALDLTPSAAGRPKEDTGSMFEDGRSSQTPKSTLVGIPRKGYGISSENLDSDSPYSDRN